MTARFKVRPLPLIALGALVACLTFVAEARAQAKKGPPAKPAPDAVKKAQEAAREQLIFNEAETLRQAIELLNLANHDYDGHRVKAIGHAKQAEKMLNDNIAKKGTAGQKAATVQEKKAEAATDQANRTETTLHERQKFSDAQLDKAHKVLVQIRDTMAQNKQAEQLIKEVDLAIGEIKIARKIR